MCTIRIICENVEAEIEGSALLCNHLQNPVCDTNAVKLTLTFQPLKSDPNLDYSPGRLMVSHLICLTSVKTFLHWFRSDLRQHSDHTDQLALKLALPKPPNWLTHQFITVLKSP